MEDTIKIWCDNNIAPGMCYGSVKGTRNRPIAGKVSKVSFEGRSGNLIYQDGTACSASYAFADVYQLENGEYEVYMESAQSRYMGNSPINESGIEHTKYTKLSEVVSYLSDYSGHDSNSCGELMEYLSERIRDDTVKLETRKWFRKLRVPILEKSENSRIIEFIKEYGSRPYNK